LHALDLICTKKTYMQYILRLLITFIIMHQSINLWAQNEQKLSFGEHSVGFRYEWIKNFAQNSCGDKEYSGPGKQLLLGIWYPAKEAATKKMTLREYVEMKNVEREVKLTENMKIYARESWFNYTLEEYSDSSYSSKVQAFEKSLDIELKAEFRAKKQPGKFPVIIYHHGAGGTYDDNAQMCEYFASHGYLVISSSFFQCKGNIVFEDTDWHSSITDLHAILQYTSNIENADINNIALLGHSRGCQIGYAAITGLNSSYKCFVALDPTWDGKTYEKLYKDWGRSSLLKYIKSNAEKVNVLVLHISSFRKNSGISKDSAKALDKNYHMQLPVTDLLVHSERHQIVTHPEHSHEAFISQGGNDYKRMHKSINDTDYKKWAKLQDKQYQFVCNATLKYFNRQLKSTTKHRTDWTTFIQSLNWKKDNAKSIIKSAKPLPLIEEEWEEILLNEGLDSISFFISREIEELGYHKFSHENLARKFFQKDRKLSKAIVDHYSETYPESWKGPYLKAIFFMNENNLEEGKKHFQRSLELSPPEGMIQRLQNKSYYIW
jgi:dienelactone hydrolase